MATECIKCGSTITHHHNYCDECYPQKFAIILTLKNEVVKQRKLMHLLKVKKDAVKKHNKKLKFDIKQLTNQVNMLRLKIDSLKTMEIKDMTNVEAEKFFGKEVYDKMKATGLLDGITCSANKEGQFVIYSCDLENAYHATKTGRALFID